MTARQQIARLLPLVLLLVLVIVGLRGLVPAPGWNGPLKAYGVVIGIALEVIFAASLLKVRSRERAARRFAESQPYDLAREDRGIEPPQALRFTLTCVLGAGMAGVGILLLTNLHLHFLAKPRALPHLNPKFRASVKPLPPGGHGGSLHIPVGLILYALLIVAIIAAVAVSIWWSTRLRLPAKPLVIDDVPTEELREAVDEARAAIVGIDDARAAIIACYVAMERRLADRGAAREVADTPDELLARAVASGAVRSGAASRLTRLFYEARFSTHPLSAGHRDAASAALDELAGELAAKPQPAPDEEAAPAAPRPGGGWV